MEYLFPFSKTVAECHCQVPSGKCKVFWSIFLFFLLRLSESFRQPRISHFPISQQRRFHFRSSRSRRKTQWRLNSAAATMADWFLRLGCPDSPPVISMPFPSLFRILLWMHSWPFQYPVLEFGTILCFLFPIQILVLGLLRTYIKD